MSGSSRMYQQRRCMDWQSELPTPGYLPAQRVTVQAPVVAGKPLISWPISDITAHWVQKLSEW